MSLSSSFLRRSSSLEITLKSLSTKETGREDVTRVEKVKMLFQELCEACRQSEVRAAVCHESHLNLRLETQRFLGVTESTLPGTFSCLGCSYKNVQDRVTRRAFWKPVPHGPGDYLDHLFGN